MFKFIPEKLSIEMGEDLGGGGGSADGSTGNIEGIDAEALMGQIQRGESVNNPASNIPPQTTQQQSHQQSAKSPAASDPQASTQAADPIIDLVIDGKNYKAPMSKVKQWAQQGRNYSSLMNEFKTKQADFDNKFKMYSEIDDYAKANPDWWKSVTESYQSRNTQGHQTAQATQAVPPELLQKLDQLEKFKSTFELDQASKALEADVKGVRDTYPDLPWDSLDENGTTLEYRVLEHATKNGIQSFKTAFRDLMHEQLVKLAADKAKEAAVNEFKTQRKSGLIGISSNPTQMKAKASQKFNSYDDAAQAAMRELGIEAG